MDEKVSRYLQKQNPVQKEICIKLRTMILTHFPQIKEIGMAEGMWYEGKFYITAFKDHVNLGVGISGLTKEELQYFEGSGKSMRHLKFYSINDIKENELLKLMELVNNKSTCDCPINWKK